MMLLTTGIGIGFVWHWLLNWTRARNVRIGWLVWALIILALLDVVSGMQNYFGLMQEYEESAAGMIIPIYGIQAGVLGVLALLLLWRQVRRANR